MRCVQICYFQKPKEGAEQSVKDDYTKYKNSFKGAFLAYSLLALVNTIFAGHLICLGYWGFELGSFMETHMPNGLSQNFSTGTGSFTKNPLKSFFHDFILVP